MFKTKREKRFRMVAIGKTWWFGKGFFVVVVSSILVMTIVLATVIFLTNNISWGEGGGGR